MFENLLIVRLLSQLIVSALLNKSLKVNGHDGIVAHDSVFLLPALLLIEGLIYEHKAGEVRLLLLEQLHILCWHLGRDAAAAATGHSHLWFLEHFFLRSLVILWD